MTEKVKDFGIEVILIQPFSIVRESLDRIGIAKTSNKILNPSCYILHKKGQYFIIHFKQLLALDGKQTNFDENDKTRLISITRLLENWGLVKIKYPELYEKIESTFVYVLPYNQKDEWEIKHKYNIGNNKRI